MKVRKVILFLTVLCSNHEYQEQVTKSFYTVVEIDQNGACPSDCHYKAKEKHYHCKWVRKTFGFVVMLLLTENIVKEEESC